METSDARKSPRIHNDDTSNTPSNSGELAWTGLFL